MATDWTRIAKALAAATTIAVGAEGVILVAYHDPVGILTQCAGDTHHVDVTRAKTREECMALLDAQMLEAIETVEKCVPGLPFNQLAAWGDAVFNLGPRIVCDTETSTAARLLREGKRDEACLQLVRWNKARIPGLGLTELPGLTKRRNREMELCLRGFV